jgi:5'-nucleotidase
MRIRVAMDWDGVHADFNQHSENLFGAQPRELTFDCPDRGHIKGDEALWAHVGTEAGKTFWSHAPVFYGSPELFAIAEPYGVQFVTGCPTTGFERAAEEKTTKINALFPGVPVQTCRSKNKTEYMQEPGDILVDDFIANIRRWQKAGGYTVYYKTHKQAVFDLKKALLKQFPEIVPLWKDIFLAELEAARLREESA